MRMLRFGAIIGLALVCGIGCSPSATPPPPIPSPSPTSRAAQTASRLPLTNVTQTGTVVATDGTNVGITINATNNGYNTGGIVSVLNAHGRFYGVVTRIAITSPGVATMTASGTHWSSFPSTGLGAQTTASIAVTQAPPHGRFAILVAGSPATNLVAQMPEFGVGWNGMVLTPVPLSAGSTFITVR